MRRGPEEGTLDTSLLDQARNAGAEVELGREAGHAASGDIVAIGPRYADGLATGYVFPTDLEDQAHCIIAYGLAPAGYAYLLVWDGKATLATCLFDRQQEWRRSRELTVQAFSRIVGDLDTGSGRSLSGYGSVFGDTRFIDEAGRLFVGEAAGLQDPEWGFGMWYAMESGAWPPHPTWKVSTTKMRPADDSTQSGMRPSPTALSTSVSPEPPSPGCFAVRPPLVICVVDSAGIGNRPGSSR
ncbi:MAG TPA: hypothetical protein VF148_16745 [Acidimicrobiia bacterium]